MAPRRLDLPEPARALFNRVIDLLDGRLSRIVPAGGQWRLGGGTALAAQWRHRLSTDLDIFLPSNSGISALDPRWNPDFTTAMSGLGATGVNVGGSGIKYSFEEGRVEITALDPVPPLDAIAATVEGRPLWVLPNACILTGKLQGRGARLPVRDIFDVCVAAREDPGALRCAVNHLDPQFRMEVLAVLAERDRDYPRQAAASILAATPQWEFLLAEGARVAIGAIEGAVYRRHGLSFAHGEAHVVVEAVGGERESSRFRSGRELAQGLLGLGLGALMVARNGTLDAFVAATDMEIAESRDPAPRRPSKRSRPEP